ncbi:hypothetical protein [Paraburkholderia sp.]|uniref:hypothetical protein n=1 Tax=Paraburkholderia sp. TaxID=1926495 RepID=UPI002397548F|nr:hypothetical protein [Paraburkholderia sp.]MDE1178887.1 hypothetical protein [Paraburkholderia sp.]
MSLRWLSWLIAILFLANLLAFVTVRGVFGPDPIAGPREMHHLDRQVHPEMLQVRAILPSQAADQPVIGGPMPAPAVAASALSQ